MSATLAVRIDSIAIWSSRLPDWNTARAVIRGDAAAPEPAPRPAPTVLAPAERRRAPDTVALALHVAVAACESAGRVPTELRSVFASTHGDLAISDYMCATLATTPAQLSPTKFHNSVHNAAAGYWSIGTGSHMPYTAVSAARYTFAVGLLEAATQAATDEVPVLYVAYDIEARGPFATVAPSRGLLGVALVLSPHHAESRGAKATLQVNDAAAALTPSRSAVAALVADNALAPCFPFVEMLARDSGDCVLAVGPSASLQVRLKAEG
jgi:hypothetical protein